MTNLSPNNRLELSGRIVGKIQERFSPNGIGHAEFLFEHRSMQYEGQLQRQAYCKIRAVISGDVFNAYHAQLQPDAQCVFIGFLSVRQQRNGSQEMVFYVQHLELIKESQHDQEAPSVIPLA